jgi:protein-S-isoprenylcysteine O-methyltransferase Ste14
MKSSAFEFRFRFWIFLVLYILGFTAPWDFKFHLDGAGPNAHVWGQLAVLLSRNGGPLSIGSAFNAILAFGIVVALVGAWLRTWGSAYLGYDVVHDTRMHGDTVVADGPYRYVRNPLYLGTWANTLALALLMPPTGAIFTTVLVIFFQLRLIFGEEAHLRSLLGAAYDAYCAKVPRLIPALRPRVPASGGRPAWGTAALAEIFMWGTALSFAVLGWRYNAQLLIQCVLVWLGVSLVVRALHMKPQAA